MQHYLEPREGNHSGSRTLSQGSRNAQQSVTFAESHQRHKTYVRTSVTMINCTNCTCTNVNDLWPVSEMIKNYLIEADTHCIGINTTLKTDY